MVMTTIIEDVCGVGSTVVCGRGSVKGMKVKRM